VAKILRISGSYRAGVLALVFVCLVSFGVRAEPQVPEREENKQGVSLEENTAVTELGHPSPFSRELLIERAKALAHLPYLPPQPFAKDWAALSFDAHRAIRFRSDRAITLGSMSQIELQLLPPGRQLNDRIRINLVEQGSSRQILFAATLFSFEAGVRENLSTGNLDFSGFRLHHVHREIPTNSPAEDGTELTITDGDVLDEFLVFQGASYFRAVAQGQVYGLSARGLTIDVGGEAGEEFPLFTEFWLNAPKGPAGTLTVYAQLDTPSATGIYTFEIAPGPTTQIDVSVVLFPRVEIRNFGLAPLTSMFLFDATNRSHFDDFREGVHDSDGLAIHNGAGEWLWRPLANPLGLQESAFVDNNPQGFGLIQRSRNFENFGDLSLQYEARPSVWIEPRGNWGRGSVTLVELPTRTETEDNIVAYWRPFAPFLPGERYEFAYRMTWGATVPITDDLLKVIDTRIGAHAGGGKIVVIDYATMQGLEDPESGPHANEIVPEIYSEKGVVKYPFVEENPHTGGLRLTFQYDPQGASSSEFRILLRKGGRAVSEKWLYRWTKQ